MSRTSFLSVVLPVESHHSVEAVSALVNKAGEYCSTAFSDYEIILVDNRSGLDLSGIKAPADVRQVCYTVQLAQSVVWDTCVLAGLERANGDYVFVFDVGLASDFERCGDLFDLAQADGVDITYLRNERVASGVPWQRRLFYFLLSRLGQRPLEQNMLRACLISRRAVNAIVRNWSATTFVNEAVSSSGYPMRALDVSMKHQPPRRSTRDERKLAWGALTRNTNFPLLIGQAAVGLMALASLVSISNALTVRLLGRNLLGGAEEYVPGWAFVVILASGGFLITNIAIYAVLRMLYVLVDENKSASLYLVERFGRL